ncbi:hypothetical protein [Sphingomonas nostoxanthinifaciens]|uniref:hypothetical protein n=1 Tax=Sphingomonas nostoxanthinifaciens TaxID=2872652 RepID=UPI001CC1FAB7|nr:hypothetical protein [Sphingomonas nostoxanthinifaciens]UAK25504.1 hypothetical protein K8P63_04885 [Sphingomonas nostoxanthinifaciens]
MSSKLPEPAAAGYGKPPAEHQFPNNSHRQRGRKRGSKNKPKTPLGLTDNERVALEEAERLMTTKSGEVMETSRAVSRSQIKTAVLGGTNAQKAYLTRLDTIQQKKRAAEEANLLAWEEYVQATEHRLDMATPEERQYLDERLLPHPADIEVDF